MEGGSRYPSRATPTAIRLPLKIRMARRTPALRRRLRSPPPRIPPLLRHQRARHRPHARRQLQYRHRHPLAPHQLQPPRPLLPLLPQSPRKRPRHGSRHPHENPGERTTRTAPKHAEPVLLPSIGASRVIDLSSIATTTASPASNSACLLRRFRTHGCRPTVTPPLQPQQRRQCGWEHRRRTYAAPSPLRQRGERAPTRGVRPRVKPAPPLLLPGATELKLPPPPSLRKRLIWALVARQGRSRFHECQKPIRQGWSWLHTDPSDPRASRRGPRHTAATGARESIFMPFHGAMRLPVHPETGPDTLR